MHDTPAKSYFSRDMRALSHGCIRLERPRDMAAAVMGTSVADLGKYFERMSAASRSRNLCLSLFPISPHGRQRTGKSITTATSTTVIPDCRKHSTRPRARVSQRSEIPSASKQNGNHRWVVAVFLWGKSYLGKDRNLFGNRLARRLTYAAAGQYIRTTLIELGSSGV